MSTPEKRPAYEPVEKLLMPTQYDPGMKRPTSIVAGAVLVLLRVVIGVVWAIELARRWTRLGGNVEGDVNGVDLPPDAVRLGLVVIIVVVGVVLAIEAVFAVLIYFGRNLPRVVVMVFAVLSISGSFVGWWVEGQEITLTTSLPSVALDILILLALSSRSAAAYARRNERR